jgi:catechol 2,3-dioxygenase-like lactoylglutathione lyase family enzyme
MKLNHLDLLVRDVRESVAYFERFFGLVLRTNRDSPALAVLSDGHGFVLVLQRAPQQETHYPEGFHLGFLVDSPDEVRALHDRALRDGAAVSDVIVNGRGTLLYFTAAEGYRIEVSCQRVTFA